MFDFAWSEIVLIGAVALIAIGPKDMPAAIRTVSSMMKKARRMAAEFQTHVDEMVREADLGDVKKAFTDIRNLNVPDILERHVDPDRTIRDTFAQDPFKRSDSPVAAMPSLNEVAVAGPAIPDLPPDPPSDPERPAAPAFIPPGMVPPPPVPAPSPMTGAPAFIPPEAVLQRQSGI